MNPPSPSAVNGDGRDAASGRFLPGNQIGRGNPTLRRVAQLRQLLLQAVTEDDFREVVAALVAKAKAGDLTAVKELLNRTLGRPPQAVALTDPDGEPLGVSLHALHAALADALAGFP